MSQQLKSFRFLLDKYGSNNKLVTQIHAQSITLGLCTNEFFSCKLLNVYKNLGNLVQAQSVFSQIKNPDIVSCTCLISLYLHVENPNRAFSVFSYLIVNGGLKPDGHSIVGALSACGRSKNLLGGKILHGMIFKFEFGSEPIVGNALIDMYSRNKQVKMAEAVFGDMVIKDVASWTSLVNGYIKCGDIVSARNVFDKMLRRNVVSWTVMIVGYVSEKTPVLGLDLFRRMRAEGGDSPTAYTIVAVLSGCADIGALDFGRSVHSHIHKLVYLMTDVAVNNALIDMYSKSGNLDSALDVFRHMNVKDAFSWTTMISGLALHGKGRHALEMFENMLTSKQTPNEVTFVSVLSACSHAGLVNEGQKIFDKLINHIGITPKIEHYGCMVDLLCRAGRLNEALKLIQNMPIDPDAIIWRSLLSACLENGNMKLAEMAGKKVIELEPEDDGAYVLLWNIYCTLNKWEEALKTRKMMRELKIKKKPGSSCIEVNGAVREFLAEDTTCHIHYDLFDLINVLLKQSKSDLDWDAAFDS